jgi:uncharacterized protein (DUF885 family)
MTRYSSLALGAAVLALVAACGGVEEDAATPRTDRAQTAETSSAGAPQADQAVATDTEEMSESDRLNQWFEAQYEEMLAFSPMRLTTLGRKEMYGQLDDMSAEAEDRRLDWYRASVEEMEESFDYDALTTDAKLSYDLWKHEFEQDVEAARWRANDYIFDQMTAVHAYLPTFMINFHRVDTAADMEAYVSRLNEFERALSQLVARAEENAAGGVRAPYFAYDAVLKESRKLIEGAPFGEGDDNSVWADAKSKIAALEEAGEIDAEQAEAFRADVEAALTGPFRDGYQRLIDFMEADRGNVADAAAGVGALPDGDAYYASRLRRSTTTDMTPDEIHEFGLAEVERIRGEMEAIMAEVEFEGDLQAFFDHVRDAEWNYYPDTDEGRQAYIDDATAAIDNIEGELPNYFGLLPKAELVVKRVEPFREQDGAAQHYYPSSPDGSRPGVYYAHLSDMTAMPKNQLEVIAYHEGLPGHHMQIAIAQELDSVPTFRTQFFSGSYVEGWALYTEKLAKEMPGTYQDPYSDFGRLTTEMWRAIRLVVDTGLHAKGWTEQQAIEYFQANSPEPLESIRSEVRRYIVWPGQATTYKIGMQKIEDLRARAEEELGDAFDIRAFHDVILGGGSLPLDLLERRVDDWIAEQRA